MILRSAIAPREAITTTALAEHGGDATVANGSEILRDFSTCINAHGASLAIREAIRDCDVSSYPDSRSTRAREAAAVAWNRDAEELICGAGAAELIHAVCFAYLAPADSVLILAPAFGEYERAARLCGATIDIHEMPLQTGTDLWDEQVEKVVQRINTRAPKLVFLASPTSPNGTQLNHAQLGLLADACAVVGGLLILDQSYDAFAVTKLGTPALPGHPSVFHLRSITKEHALAGVRVAFGVAHSAVVRCVERARVPWATSAVAQAAAVASFLPESVAQVEWSVKLLREEKQRIETSVRDFGFTSEPSSTHYLLVRVANATQARQTLAAQHALLVRDCTSFGLPHHIRVAARTRVENVALLLALQACPQLIGEVVHD